MKNFKNHFGVLAFISISAFAAPNDKKTILADLSILEEAGIKAVQTNEELGLGVAKISSMQESMLLKRSHERGRCGGFEFLSNSDLSPHQFDQIMGELKKRKRMDERESLKKVRILARTGVQEAIAKVDEAQIKSWVSWLSSFPTRYHKAQQPNLHVDALKAKLEELLKAYPQVHAAVSLIEHRNTQQKSLRLRIEGTSQAEEIVAMGAHLDSINSSFFPTNNKAPGSDDDASGSASLLEALRLLLPMAPFERSIEFFWYAGEEGGLLGSAEIASAYKSEVKKVVGVLQLDMTLYPGSGAQNIASMSDFTSPEMRSLLAEFNRLYLNINIIEDRCGYGCSDHASWYRNGFPTLMPTEATFRQMNRNIHTASDVIDSGSSFEHAAIFSKIAVAFASHLGSP